MFKKPLFNYLLIFFMFFVILGLFLINYQKSVQSLKLPATDNLEEEIILDRQEIIDILPGSSFSQLMIETGLGASLANEIYDVSLEEYDLARIRAGNQIVLSYQPDLDILKSLYYQINSEEEFLLSRQVEILEAQWPIISQWQAIRRPIDYELRIEIKEAKIESSMYQAALDNNIDERAIIALANAFQWTLDFSMDSQKGDEVKFIYQARYLDDQYIMPGRILAAKYTNSGREHQIFYFVEDEDNKGYFDLEAKSVQKIFLRAPLEYRYISSGFTAGSRYIQAFNISTGHRAIDYAAPMGTPVRAVGDGTITYVGWNGSYGNFLSIRHNDVYRTNYAHLSAFAVSRGQTVEQGQIIGYVGSTGLSTGPHLHYEMVKNGVKINPLTEVLPPGEAIKEKNKERFYQEIAPWQAKLE